MENLFDSANYPDSEPEELLSGSFWAWTRSDITAAYPVAEYTLEYSLTLQESPYTSATISTNVGTGAHLVEVNSASVVYIPGVYRWQAIVKRIADDIPIIVDENYFTIKPGVGDTRTDTYATLTAIQATIRGAATEKQSSYSIGGRALSLRTYDELLTLEREYLKRWASEQSELDRKSGKTVKTRVLVKMSA